MCKSLLLCEKFGESKMRPSAPQSGKFALSSIHSLQLMRHVTGERISRTARNPFLKNSGFRFLINSNLSRTTRMDKRL